MQTHPLTVLGMESGSSFFWGGPASPPGAPGKAPGIPCWGPAMGPPNCPVQNSRGFLVQQSPHWSYSPSHFTSYLLVGGIQVKRQLRDRDAGNHQGLEEMAQGRVYPCPPREAPSSVLLVGPPLACSLRATAEEECGVTVGQEASVVDP